MIEFMGVCLLQQKRADYVRSLLGTEANYIAASAVAVTAVTAAAAAAAATAAFACPFTPSDICAARVIILLEIYLSRFITQNSNLFAV